MKLPESLPGPARTLLDDYAPRFLVAAGAAGEDPRVYPLLSKLAWSLAHSPQPVSLGVAGSQGSGKSTMASLLARMLSACFGVKTAILSLDDFYLERSARQHLAQTVHPLLATRGVPGTHDHRLMQETVFTLMQGGVVKAPVFDKAVDDRRPEPRELGPVDVVICEGWCWGAIPEPEERLRSAVNQLESEQDGQGVWRGYVNEQLMAYQDLFHTDASVFYKAPSMDAVYRWRLQQEQELGSRQSGAAVMDAQGVRDFIAYYERLTRWMLETQPASVDVCVHLGEDHRILQVQDR